MFREILRSRKFIIGLSILLISISVMLLKSGKPGFAAHQRESPETRQVEFVPSLPVKEEISSDEGELQGKIDAKIDEVISLIDDILN